VAPRDPAGPAGDAVRRDAAALRRSCSVSS
jgi:hypothetical protein